GRAFECTVLRHHVWWLGTPREHESSFAVSDRQSNLSTGQPSHPDAIDSFGLMQHQLCLAPVLEPTGQVLIQRRGWPPDTTRREQSHGHQFLKPVADADDGYIPFQ